MTDNLIMTLLVNTAVFSALFCIMLILRSALVKRISPALMLMLWFVIVLKLIIPFGFESKISILPQPAENAIIQQYEPSGSLPEAHAPAADTAVYAEPDKSTRASDTQQSVSAVSENLTVQKTIDWNLAILGVWGAGALLTGAVLCLGTVNLRKRIKHSKANTPQHVLDIFEECRQTLGIRRNIGVVTQSSLDSPVIMGTLSPVLALPEDNDTHDRKLKHIFLHELTHYKRGDLWAIELMNILRALYWFNPLVWVCFKLIRCDMETACDMSVLNILGQEQRLPYIGTVLGFAGRKAQRSAAAMGLSDGRPAMEKRIRGMFGRSKTGIRGRITAVLLAVLMLAVGALTACQPAISGTAAAAEYKTTGHWKESIQQDKLTIDIDTDIMQPNVSEYPVVTVEPVVFSQQRVDELIHYFAGDKKLYKRHGMTKADYAEQIASYLEPRWSGGRQVVTWQAQFEASQLEGRMKDAPQEYPKEYIDSTLTYDIEHIDETTIGEYKEGGKNFVNAMVENGDGNDAWVSVSNSAKDLNDMTSFFYGTPMLVGYTPETVFDTWMSDLETNTNAEAVSDDRKNGHFDEYAALYENVTLKQEDAQKTAEKAISDLGIKDLTLTGASKTVSLDHPDKGGWQFEYARQNGGIMMTPFCGIIDTDPMKPAKYNAPYYLETLTVLVTEDGIQHFSWQNCVKPIESEPENAQLLPFDDIKKALIDSIGNKKPIVKILNSKTVKVSSAKLCMGYVDTDDPMKMKIVPVWVFETMENHTEGQYLDLTSGAYVINAIDGGAIAF